MTRNPRLGVALIAAGVAIVVGSFLPWAVIAESQLFDYIWPTGLDAPYGQVAVLLGIGLAVIGLRLATAEVDVLLARRLALGWAAGVFAVLVVAVAGFLALRPVTDGLEFDQPGVGLILVAIGALLATAAAWRLRARIGSGVTTSGTTL